MYFQQNLKNKFLHKKNQQKKKIQQQSQSNSQSIQIQKHIRAFISRNKTYKELSLNNKIKSLLILKNELKQCQIKQVNKFAGNLNEQLKKSPLNDENNFLAERLILTSLKNDQIFGLGVQFLKIGIANNFKYIQNVLKNNQFFQVLKIHLCDQKRKGKGVIILNIIIQKISYSNELNFLSQQKVFQLIMNQFRIGKMQIQLKNNSQTQQLLKPTIIYLLKYLNLKKFKPITTFEHFVAFKNILFSLLNYKLCQKQKGCGKQIGICYLIQNILKLIVAEHEYLVDKISKQISHLLILMEDNEDLQYFQNKIAQHQLMESFSNQTLQFMKKLFQNQIIKGMFLNQTQQENKYVKTVMANVIKELSNLFEDRKLIFMRSLLSSEQILKSMMLTKNPDLYEGLKMKLFAMDDDQFKSFNLFDQNQWKKIIQEGLLLAFDIIKSKILKLNKQSNKKLILFSKKNDQELRLKSIADSLQNLYKKSIRTKKISQKTFININLSNSFSTFNFGPGALAIAQMLKLFPFSFTFQSRLAKFKEFIKSDKKNHDRTLFLQDQIDEDLIIQVRRGHQFMDAYQTCLNRDLRKKYIIVFFNEQGLEEEGIDGGGLIKEFINRVLKSGFSQIYGLFQQTTQHQVIPNPYSNKTQQYQFIGKLIGKAVYEGINIEQKFVQPFLNLVIGRKNTFQDLQYIDPQIYKSLVQIKNMDQGIQQIQQTFVILDQQPNGDKRYIDLLCPSKQPSLENQVYVNSQNKMDFIMSYSHFKCNTQLQEKTRLFRKGFLKVMKPEWLTLFNNQQLNLIISGGSPNFSVSQLKHSCVYVDYHQKDLTIIYLWQTLQQFSAQDKSKFLLYVTSCSRPPTLGFNSMKPKICISKDDNEAHLPTANTCMNVFRLPNYKNKIILKQKLLYAINSKAGFEFA